jgi:hypothetical protein
VLEKVILDYLNIKKRKKKLINVTMELMMIWSFSREYSKTHAQIAF